MNINYYDELGIDSNLNLEEIQKELSKQEALWTRRQVNNPENATEKLALINQARKVFNSETSRFEYDRELKKSKEKPEQVDPNVDRYNNFKRWTDDAQSYFDNKQYDLAKTSLERAISYYDYSSDNDAFMAFAAKTYWNTCDYSLAVDYINKAIVINPKNTYYYILKAGMYMDQALSVQGYGRNTERDSLIQKSRETLEWAANVARKQNDKKAESAAYGMLASYYMFVPVPDRKKAEEYAQISYNLGNEWGNASKVLEEINRQRLQEAKNAEEQKRRQEQLERERKQQLLQKEQRERIRQENEELERQKQKRKRAMYNFTRTVYIFCWIAFFAWSIYAFYNVFAKMGHCLNLGLPISGDYLNVGLITIVYFLVIALWIMFEKISFAYSIAPKVISSIIFGTYLLVVCVIILSYGSGDSLAWKYTGICAFVFVGVLIVFNLIGKAIAKKIK